MRSHFYKISLVLITILTLGAVTQYLAEKYVVGKIKQLSVEQDIELQYDDISINLFLLKASVKNVSVVIRNNSNKHTLSLFASAVYLHKFSLIDFLFEKKVVLKNISVDHPKIKVFKQKSIAKSSVGENSTPIIVENFNIKNGSVEYYDKSLKDSLNFKIENFDLKLSEVVFPKPISNNTALPIAYKDISSTIFGLTKKVGEFELLRIEEVLLDKSNILALQLKLETKYGKQELSKFLKSEKDHVSLTIPKFEIKEFFFNSLDSTNIIGAQYIFIQQAKLNLFRDKAVADNAKYKSLYSEKIRNLRFKINFLKVVFENSNFNYEQLSKNSQISGNLYFTNINASASFSNLEHKKNQIQFSAKGDFMDKAQVILETDFNSFTSDAFTASGSVKKFEARTIQKFLEKTQRIRLEGRIDEMYFNLSGNNTHSNGTVKMKYSDLKLEVLKKDRIQVNTLLTAVGNLFLKNEEENSKEYQYGEIDIKRDQTKSFFNFLWISLRDGLKDVLINKNN